MKILLTTHSNFEVLNFITKNYVNKWIKINIRSRQFVTNLSTRISSFSKLDMSLRKSIFKNAKYDD